METPEFGGFEELSNRVFLVADDNTLVRKSLTQLLERCGGTIIEAEDGEQAIERASQESVCLAIIDFHMPRKNGLEVLAAVRQMKTELPFIILSGHSEFITADVTANCRLLQKPVSLRVLFATIDALL